MACLAPVVVRAKDAPTGGGPALERATAPAGESALPGGFVLGLGVDLQLCPVFPYPSGDLSLFLGAALPVTPRRPGHWVALGYRGMFGLGGADLCTTAGRAFLFAHRHHLAVQGVTGRRARLFYDASFGVAGFAAESWTHAGMGKPLPLAVEGEVRLGYVLARGSSGLQLVTGGQLRLTGLVFPDRAAPFPTLGLFVGVVFGRGLAAR